MARYLDRLIERVAGSAPALPPVATAPRVLDREVPPLADERVTPAPSPSAPVIETVREATRIEHYVERSPVSRAPRTVADPAHVLTEVARPAALSPIAPAPVDVVPAPADPPSLASIKATPLRAPDPEEPGVDRWLAPPAPAAATDRVEATPVVPSITKPEPAAVEPPRAVLPQAPAATAPHVEDRPTLTIGRLVVEVRNQPAPQPAQTTVVHVTAPASSAPAPSILNRGFGLGQS